MADPTLQAATRVEAALGETTELLLIGALAMAAHGYARQTTDLDLAVAVPVRDLPELVKRLQAAGLAADYSPPDAEDPLGGVITVTAEGCLPVQIVNFDNSPSGGFPALVRDALARSTARVEGLPGQLPTVEDLILFKVYAGGPKSKLDILELLVRTKVDLPILRERAQHYRLDGELEKVLSEAGV
jgi:hypothetical protein